MTIARALTEIKMLDSRIVKKIGESRFTDVQSNKNKTLVTTPGLTREMFEKNAKSAYDSIQDLINRRKRIKSEILKSNGKTVVEVAGERMTVVEAIDRKNTVEYDRTLLQNMRDDILSSERVINQADSHIKQQVDKFIEHQTGDGKNKDVLEQMADIIKQNHGVTLVDPLGLRVKIEDLDKKIDDFVMNVDFVLSESNAVTKITF